MGNIIYNGVTYKTQLDMCRALDVNYKTYIQRKHNGYSLDECINGKKKNKRNNKITYKGITYESEAAMCRALGINYKIYKSRKAHGQSFEQCIYKNFI